MFNARGKNPHISLYSSLAKHRFRAAETPPVEMMITHDIV